MKKSLVILTGAGVSAESGLKTFRDSNGLWENHAVEDVASIDGFIRNPSLVQKFYNERRRQLRDPSVNPNAAHKAIAEIQKSWDGEFLLVTQNVDNLHERAGSTQVIHMHGELSKVRCQDTDQVFVWMEDITNHSLCPCCQKAGSLRPHIVWFGEIPLHMDEIYLALESCDVFVSIGTSGLVYPAAGFVSATPKNCRRIEINMDRTAVSPKFDEHHIGPATIKVPEILGRL